jgi:hypothetical protein
VVLTDSVPVGSTRLHVKDESVCYGGVMSSTAHMISGVLLLIVITVMFGGFSLLWLLPRDRLTY